MAAALDLQAAAICEFGPAIALGCRQLCESGQGIEAGDGPSGIADGCGLLANLVAQAAKQVVFPLVAARLELQDPSFPLLEFRRDEALFIAQGLPANPVIRHGRCFGAADGEEITKAAVELQPQVGVAAGFALPLLNASQPVLLLIQSVAQIIEVFIHPVVNQAAFTERHRWLIHQLEAQQLGQLLQIRPGLLQIRQRGCAAAFEQISQQR